MKKSIYLLLAVFFLIYIATGSTNSLLGSAWPAISADIAIPISWQSIIIITTYTAAAIGSMAAQYILAVFRSWAPLTVGMFIITGAVFVYSVTYSFSVLVVFGVVIGFFFGMQGSITNGYVTKHYSASSLSWLHCFYSLGNTFAPAIMSYFIISAGSWRMGYHAVGWVVFTISVILLLSFQLWKAHGPVLPDRIMLGRIKDDGKSPTSDPGIRIKPPRELFRVKGGAIIPVNMFVYCSYEVTLGLWITSYLTEEKDITAGVAAGMLAVLFAAQFAGRIVGAFLTFRISDRYIIRAAMIVLFVSVVIFSLTPLTLLTPVLIVMGFASGPIFPLLIHEAPLIVGKENAQGVIGLQVASANIGTAFVPFLIGLITDFIGFRIFPLYLILFVGLALTIKSILDARTEKREE